MVDTADTWQTYGRHMADTWQTHGRNMAYTWEDTWEELNEDTG